MATINEKHHEVKKLSWQHNKKLKGNNRGRAVRISPNNLSIGKSGFIEYSGSKVIGKSKKYNICFDNGEKNMISTDCMDNYTQNKELNREILKWINGRILSLLKMYMDLGDRAEWGFEYLCICFPRNFVEENRSKCLCILRDLCDILSSSYIRKDLKLIYKYVLIKLVEYYQILYEDAKDCGEEGLCDIYFPHMEENLVKKIYSEYGYQYSGRVNIEMLEEEHPQILIEMGLEDIDGLFWNDVFDDMEIDVDSIDEFVNDCIDSIERGEYVKWDLGYYSDLMSRDTKDRYLKIKPLIEKVRGKMEDIIAEKVVQEYIQDELRKPINKDRLIKDICTACMFLQGNELDLPKNENGRNTYIRNILRSKGYDIADQTLRGKSETGKQSGELDFEIMDTSEKPYAIFEGLNLNNFAESGRKYWNDHLIKLLNNYNPIGIPLAFLVSYAKCNKENFNEYYLEYYQYISITSCKNYSILFCQQYVVDETYIRCIRVIYECGGICTTIYHILTRMDN